MVEFRTFFNRLDSFESSKAGGRSGGVFQSYLKEMVSKVFRMYDYLRCIYNSLLDILPLIGIFESVKSMTTFELHCVTIIDTCLTLCKRNRITMNRLVDLFRSGSQLFFGKIKKSKWKSERERKECIFRTWSKGNDVNGLSIFKSHRNERSLFHGR